MSKFTAIYVRRSVSDKDKGNNSLSIDAQREECIRYVGEEADYKVYCDDGKSGKDVYHRPEFMQMMSDAKEGLIDKIVVKKYDRFSRNMREYLNITDELDRYGVGVISLSEPFNTETKEGRMMRNNLLNLNVKQLRRELRMLTVQRLWKQDFIRAVKCSSVFSQAGRLSTEKQVLYLFRAKRHRRLLRLMRYTKIPIRL